MNLRDLEYLVAVADHRNFGRAAKACFVSQPTLSTQIKKLENELDAILFERGARSILLTPTGEHIVDRARHVLGAVADIRNVAARASNPLAGTLRFGLFPTLGPYLLPHVLHTVRDAFPDLELLLVEEQSDSLLSKLRDGDLDCALLAAPVTGDGLISVPVFREDFVALIPAGHPLDQPGPVTLADLIDHRVLLLTEGHCLRDQALDVCTRAGNIDQHRVGFSATSLETLRHMVAAGVGVTLLPRLAVSEPVAPTARTVVREFTEPVPHRDIVLVARAASVYADLLPAMTRAWGAVPSHLVIAPANSVAPQPHRPGEQG